MSSKSMNVLRDMPPLSKLNFIDFEDEELNEPIDVLAYVFDHQIMQLEQIEKRQQEPKAEQASSVSSTDHHHHMVTRAASVRANEKKKVIIDNNDLKLGIGRSPLSEVTNTSVLGLGLRFRIARARAKGKSRFVDAMEIDESNSNRLLGIENTTKALKMMDIGESSLLGTQGTALRFKNLNSSSLLGTQGTALRFKDLNSSSLLGTQGTFKDWSSTRKRSNLYRSRKKFEKRPKLEILTTQPEQLIEQEAVLGLPPLEDVIPEPVIPGPPPLEAAVIPGPPPLEAAVVPGPPQPELPAFFQQRISALGGTTPVLVIQKALYQTDLKKQENRLSMPLRAVITEFLAANEIEYLDIKYEKRGRNAIETLFLDTIGNQWIMPLRLWDMRKDAGTKSSKMYVLTNPWIKMALGVGNKLVVGDVVQVWAFRVGRRLGLALVKLG